MWFRIFFPLILFIVVVGCAALPDEAPQTFDLTTLSDITPLQSAKKSGKNRYIILAEPEMPQILAGTSLILRPRYNQFAQLSGAQWADNLPTLLQEQLLQNFEHSLPQYNFSKADEGLYGDLTLRIEFSEFYVYLKPVKQVRIKATLRLVDEVSGKIIAHKNFTYSAPITSITPATGADALGKGVYQLSLDMVAWLGKNI